MSKRTLRIRIAVGCILALSSLAYCGEDVSTVVALVDFNPTLGDLPGNVTRIQNLVGQALAKGAKIVVVPEQATTGFHITKEQALGGLAIVYPFVELKGVRALAKKHHAFVVVGIAERQIKSGTLFNTAVVFKPSGALSFQRKRLAFSNPGGWNARGDTPFEVYPTPWGNIAVLICADSYLMDWVRIVTLKGADIVLLPSNWWGQNHQTELWSARARENGIWILAANRWGMEPSSYPPPGFSYMSDGPSATIAPSGLVLQRFEANDLGSMADTIIYQTIRIPKSRIGGNNPTFTVANRRPSAYTALSNSYYVPPENKPVPDLPPAGSQSVLALAYQPSDDSATNFKTLSTQLLRAPPESGSLIVLPGLGVSPASIDPVANPPWFTQSVWPQIVDLVAKCGAQGLVTSVLVQTKDSPQRYLAAVYVPAQGSPVLFPQVHDSGDLRGSGKPPQLIQLRHAEVAVMTGIDSLFPEIGTEVAKSGADIAVIVSAVAGRGTRAIEAAGISLSGHPKPASCGRLKTGHLK